MVSFAFKEAAALIAQVGAMLTGQMFGPALLEGRTTNAMLRYRGGVLTPYGAPTPLCPSGYDGTG